MGGLPREVLECPELLSLLLRPLRGDLEAVETYVHSGKRPLECPITVFGGLADDAVKYGELAEWRQHTNARFRIQMFEGNHFYLYNARQALADSIRGELLTADRTCAMAVTSP
jgi:medium-chain acyl-[acyl-carrier-protein] hydrolase